MLNTTTLAHLYSDFVKQGTIPHKPTADGFVKLMCGSFMMPIFISFVVQQGYTMSQVEDWERDTFDESDAERFFEDVEHAFAQVED